MAKSNMYFLGWTVIQFDELVPNYIIESYFTNNEWALLHATNSRGSTLYVKNEEDAIAFKLRFSL